MVNLSKIAQSLQWIDNLKSDPEKEKEYRPIAIETIEKECADLPSGSGLDSGVKIDIDRSRPERIVFNTEFHHLNENGYYDGWTVHCIIVTPKFGGFDLKVTGINQNGIKEYLHELFDTAFTSI